MELSLYSVHPASFSTTREPKLQDCIIVFPRAFPFPSILKSKEPWRKTSVVSSALAETAASIAVAATVVGAAATLLARRSKASEPSTDQAPSRPCNDCGGSGICPECKGEGFVLKRLSDGSAEKARLNAKNMATRYTAGLPKKWSYCTKCSSTRSCRSCDGRGKIFY